VLGASRCRALVTQEAQTDVLAAQEAEAVATARARANHEAFKAGLSVDASPAGPPPGFYAEREGATDLRFWAGREWANLYKPRD
jgi:hypothetical protein